MRSTRFSFALLFCLATSLFAVGQKIDPAKDIKWPTGTAGCLYNPFANTCDTVSSGTTASNGIIDSTGGTQSTNCGIVFEERAAGTTTINLPTIVTGCKGTITRGASAGVITIAPPGGVSYDGVTTGLRQGSTIGWWTDGTGYHSTLVPTLPVQITATFVGLPANSQVMLFSPMTVALTIPSSCTGSYMKAATAAAASAAFTLIDVTTSTTLCTATFAISGTTATFSGSGGSVAVGDVLKITGPSTADSTLATIGASIYATR